MKAMADAASGYLRKASPTSWVECLAHYADVNTYIGDTTYLDVGKRKFSTSRPIAGGDPGEDCGEGSPGSPNWRSWQVFLRLSSTMIRKSHEITSAKIRLWIYRNGADNAFAIRAFMLDSTYGTLEPIDWDAAGSLSVDASTTTIGTAPDGTTYLDIILSAAMLTRLKTKGTIDFRLAHESPLVEPTNNQFLRCYSDENADATKRPYLEVIVAGKREQIIAALVTRLQTIAAGTDYSTSPVTVTRKFQELDKLDASKFPVIFILGQREQKTHYPSQTDDCDWLIYVLGAVYSQSRDDFGTDINALVEDIEHCIELDQRLGLGPEVIDWALVEAIETAADFEIDDNRAAALVTVGVRYPRYLNET
jgi:hypothetical protein